MENLTAPTVYVILTQGTDYYDQLEFHSVYASKEAAEAKAAELRVMPAKFPLEEGELEFDDVQVVASPLR